MIAARALVRTSSDRRPLRLRGDEHFARRAAHDSLAPIPFVPRLLRAWSRWILAPMSRYELKRTSDSQFLFNLEAANNEVILTSERYKAKADAENGIESVRTNSALDERFERRIAADGKPYFVLKAPNGEVIGRSEMYASNAAMEKGIRSVKTNAPIARLVDITDAAAKPAARPKPRPPAAAEQREPMAERAAVAGSPQEFVAAAAAAAGPDAANLHIALWRAFQEARREVEEFSEQDAASDRESFAAAAAVAIMLGGDALAASRGIASSPGSTAAFAKLFEGAADQPLVSELVALYDGLRRPTPELMKPRLMEAAARPRVLAMLNVVVDAWRAKGPRR